MLEVQLRSHEGQCHFIHSQNPVDGFTNITYQCIFAFLVFLLPIFTCAMANKYSANNQAYRVVKQRKKQKTMLKNILFRELKHRTIATSWH